MIVPRRLAPLLIVVASLLSLACADAPSPGGGRGISLALRSSEPNPPPPAPPPWSAKPIVVPPRPGPAKDSIRGDSLADSVGGRRPVARALGYRPFRLSSADSARWPVRGPAPLPGALLPEHFIVAYYGNPRSTRMGILGQIPPEEMLPRLERTAAEWAKAAPGRKVLPALHLIATVAQGKPGPGKKYRLRMGDSLINTVAGWAEERGWIMFVDVQTGHSTVREELEPLLPFLRRPYVHLALDPEFAMKQGGIPGRRIGTLDAEDVNYAIEVLGRLVDDHKLPPKILIVHRFTRRMLTNTHQIRLDPRVQVVIQMDGFGSPALKQDAYRFWIVPEPVQFTGFKLFYKNDKPLMTPEQVLGGALYPVPVYVQYQ